MNNHAILELFKEMSCHKNFGLYSMQRFKMYVGYHEVEW